MKAKRVFVWVTVAIALAAGCMPLSTPLPPEPTSTPPPTSTATATIVWFPPTNTPEPLPTIGISPTVEQRSPAGELIFSDDFSDPDPWQLAQSASTSAALGNGALTLALDQPGGYLFTLRDSPQMGDFYLEVTASPSLCKSQDEYGLLLRVSEDLDFYRFSLSCDGYLRLDKFFNGKASSPYPRTASGMVPPGAPSSSRLAVWAKGKEMRFYVNNQQEFRVSDPSLARGSLGFFIRSAGDNAVTVSFTDLEVRKPSN